MNVVEEDGMAQHNRNPPVLASLTRLPKRTDPPSLRSGGRDVAVHANDLTGSIQRIVIVKT
jgi:hypothetical protein